MTDRKLLRRLVERYYTNQATPEELAVFIHLQKEGALDEVLNEYLSDAVAEEAQNDEGLKKAWFPARRIWRYAASVSILLLCSYLSFDYWEKNQYIIVQTDRYKEKKIELSDGSVVTLNRNSAFKYPKKWTGDAREVSLQSGEAYFQITKNDEYRSFIVHMPDKLEIGVLGTTFNAASRDGETRIYLETGEIKIAYEDKEALLEAGEQAYFNNATKALEVMQGNGEASLAWKDNMFFFDDTPLPEIAATLEDFYHIKILIDGTDVGGLRFTGKISRSDRDAVLAVISRTLRVNIRADEQPAVADDPGPHNQLSD